MHFCLFQDAFEFCCSGLVERKYTYTDYIHPDLKIT